MPLVVIAGKEYGTRLLARLGGEGHAAARACARSIAESFERIHRSNLVGMGILPLQFKPGENAESLGLTGQETFTIRGLAAGLRPRQEVTVDVATKDGKTRSFTALARLDTPVDIRYYTNGGILHTVLRKMLRG